MGAAKDNGKYDRLRKPLRKSLDVIDLSDIWHMWLARIIVDPWIWSVDDVISVNLAQKPSADLRYPTTIESVTVRICELVYNCFHFTLLIWTIAACSHHAFTLKQMT